MCHSCGVCPLEVFVIRPRRITLYKTIYHFAELVAIDIIGLVDNFAIFARGNDDKGRLAGVQRETWNQGIWFIWYDPEGQLEPELEICRIENGRAIFRGMEFTSTVDDYGLPVV